MYNPHTEKYVPDHPTNDPEELLQKAIAYARRIRGKPCVPTAVPQQAADEPAEIAPASPTEKGHVDESEMEVDEEKKEEMSQIRHRILRACMLNCYMLSLLKGRSPKQ